MSSTLRAPNLEHIQNMDTGSRPWKSEMDIMFRSSFCINIILPITVHFLKRDSNKVRVEPLSSNRMNRLGENYQLLATAVCSESGHRNDISISLSHTKNIQTVHMNI